MTYRIITICTGNICRSPMGEYLLRAALEDANLAEHTEVTSCGTTGWEVGNPVDPRAAALLRARGIEPGAHRAQAMTRQDLEDADLLITMDNDHVGPVKRLIGSEHHDKVRMIRSFDPQAGEDTGIRDPWYGDEADFDLTAEQLDAAIPGIVAHVREALAKE